MLVARKFFYAHEKMLFIVVRNVFIVGRDFFYSSEKIFFIVVRKSFL